MKDRTPRTKALLRLGSALFSFTLGCADPLKEAQRLEEPRVLGVRVATPTDQASLNPGEGATFEVLLAGPTGGLTARLAYELCEAAESTHGVPFCAGPVFAQGTVSTAGPTAFEVPAATKQEARLALLGAVCFDSEPRLSPKPLDWSCSGAESPLGLSFDATTSGNTFVNANPDLSELSVTIGGLSIPLEAAETAPACADGTPELSAGPHDVRMQLGEGASDPRTDGGQGSSEALQLSQFSTRGKFASQFGFVDPGQEPAATLEWDGSGVSGPVKQYLVVRDGRGGVSWASWTLCLR